VLLSRASLGPPAVVGVRASGPPPASLAGIFVVSAATLLLQMTFIRVFSAAIWYHFAFLVVSIALFGIGASGAALAVRPDRFRDPRWLGGGAVLFALSAVLAYVGTVAIPFAPFRIFQEPLQVAWFLLDDLLLVVPFFSAGATIALALRQWPRHVGRIYAFDLMGAALGPVLMFLVLPLMGARGAVALAALMGAGAAALLSPTRANRLASGFFAIGAAALVLAPGCLPDVRPDESKGVPQLERQGGRLVHSQWDPLARIDVVEIAGRAPVIFVDAAAATAMAPPARSDQARRELSALAFQMVQRPSVAIIGPGGGTDVQNALALGARQITAVEINPAIVDLVTGRYAAQVGHVFTDPRVRLVRDEGRSFLGRTPQHFGVIAFTLIDTWAASASGAFSLSENYLYTTEGLESYLEHLDPSGYLAITRWYYETPRLVAMAREALARLGVREPWRNVAVVNSRLRTLVLIKREPFTAADVAALRLRAALVGGTILHDPTADLAESEYGELLAAAHPTSWDKSDVLLVPASDESPFFFQMTRWRKLWSGLQRRTPDPGTLQPLAIPVAQIVLLTALAIGVLLSIGLLALPCLAGAPPPPGVGRWLGYFFALGVSYIVVEIVLMQRLTLFLGHPTYSVTAVLFAILLSSGLGSAWSGRRQGTAREVGGLLAWGLPLAIAFVAFAVPPLLRPLLGLPLPARMAVGMGVIAPLAFLMGMPFPIGIRLLAARGGRMIPWAWAANGCGSVLGSVGAVLGAMLGGFGVTLMSAGAIYAVAVLGIGRTPDRLE